MICPRVTPMARRMPISLRFCTTETNSTLAMPNATESPTKNRIAVLAVICALTALKNCALVAIQLSASTPVAAVIRAPRPRRRRRRDRHVDARHAARKAEQALRRVQRDKGGALVGALVAQVEDAADR